MPLARARDRAGRRPSATARSISSRSTRTPTRASRRPSGSSRSRPSRRSRTARSSTSSSARCRRSQVERFLDRIVPSEADALVAEGGDANLRRALELEPGRADAAIPLARSLAAAGDREGALELLANVPELVRRRRPGDAPAPRPTTRSSRTAFAALDAGETEAGLDALIDAIAAGDDASARTSCARSSSACSTSSARRTRSRATRAASSPPRCTDVGRGPYRRQRQLAHRRDRRRRLVGLEVVERRQADAEQAHRL